MKSMKEKAALAAYVLIVAVFFTVGYFAGMVNGKNQVKETVAAVTPSPGAVNASAKADETEIEYELILEGERLTIYENNKNGRNIIARCEISLGVYPADDISVLKKGMTFADKTDAMAMFENFAS